jgi:hypothetical protein
VKFAGWRQRLEKLAGRIAGFGCRVLYENVAQYFPRSGIAE